MHVISPCFTVYAVHSTWGYPIISPGVKHSNHGQIHSSRSTMKHIWNFILDSTWFVLHIRPNGSIFIGLHSWIYPHDIKVPLEKSFETRKIASQLPLIMISP